MRDEHEGRLRMALKAHRWARTRFYRALDADDRDVAGVLTPVVEALWWAVSVDEELEREHGAGVYRSKRDADPDGRVMLGVMYARNRCGHQRAVAIEDLSNGITWPADGGGIEWPIRWHSAAWKRQLPPGDPKFTNAKLETAYAQHLAGGQVSDTFASLTRWFGRYDPDRSGAGRG